MQQLQYNGEIFYLCTVQPDWQSPVSLELHFPSYAEKGWDGKESSRGTAESLEVERYSYSTWIEGNEARSFQYAIAERTTERLLVPLWPALRPTAEFQALPIEAGICVTFEMVDDEIDAETIFVHAGKSPGAEYNLTTNTMTAPLIACDFADGAPSLNQDTDEAVSFELEFVGDAGGDERISFQPALSDPEPTFRNFPWSPFVPDYSEQAPGADFQVLKGRSKIGGSGRLSVDYHGSQPFVLMSFVATEFEFGDVAQLAGFFEARHGVRDSFWLPSGKAADRILERVDPWTLKVEDGLLTVVDHELLAMVGPEWPPTGNEISSVEYNAKNKVNLATFVEEIPEISVETTSLQSLELYRFPLSTLSIEWETDEAARISVTLEQLQFSDLASDGPQETLASLYEFRFGNEVTRLTSFERAVEFDGELFEPAMISHGEISAGLELDDSTQLTADWRVTPMRELHDGTKPKMGVIIRRVELESQAVTRAFHGELQMPRLDARTLTAEVSLFSRELDDRIPRVRFQRPCNWRLFDPGCGLLEGDFQKTAIVSAIEGRKVTVTGLDPAPDVDDYSYGSIKGPGGQPCLITQSGSDWVVVGAGDLCPSIEIGAEVTILPGCDGRPETCKDRFNNFENYGGHQVADGNLSLVKVSSDVGGGKK